MDKAIERLLSLFEGYPVLVTLSAILLIAVHYGHSYITAISSARSQKRRDDVELSDKEQRLKERIDAKRKRLEK